MDLMTALEAIPGTAPATPYVAAAIAICAGAAVVLPPPAAGATGAYPVLYRLVNFVALNFGQARNASAVRPVAATSPSPAPLAPASVITPSAAQSAASAQSPTPPQSRGAQPLV